VSQLIALLKPFSGRLVSAAPPGKFGSYVSHYVVEQRLLAVVGPFDWEIIEMVRDADDTLTGCIGRLGAEVDGRWIQVCGAGDVENPGNSKTDGERLKLAESDAFKRAAMRLGVGLHLWAGDDFFVYDALERRENPDPQLPMESMPGGSGGSGISAVPEPTSGAAQ